MPCKSFVFATFIMIPPKRFDISPPDWGMLRRSRCVQIFVKFINDLVLDSTTLVLILFVCTSIRLHLRPMLLYYIIDLYVNFATLPAFGRNNAFGHNKDLLLSPRSSPTAVVRIVYRDASAAAVLNLVN